jgi:hypothetical protein
MIVSTYTQEGKPIEDVSVWSTKDKVLVRCEICENERWLSYVVATNSSKRTGMHRCKSCALTGIEKPHLRGKPVYTASGEEHHSWKGGTYVSSDGYRKVRTSKRSYKSEHVLVIEEEIGRPLDPGEVVHHIDGDKLNNLSENLVVMPKQSHHKIAHHSLQQVGYELVRSGLVFFNRDTMEYVAHRKLRELLGHPEAGNQQPSQGGNASEGSETRGEAQVVNNSPKSAGHS